MTKKRKNIRSEAEQAEAALLEGKYFELPKTEEKRERAHILAAARETVKKQTKEFRTNVRISNEDKALLDQRAAREGFGYQTLITSVIHKFVTGQLVDIEEARRALGVDVSKKLLASKKSGAA